MNKQHCLFPKNIYSNNNNNTEVFFIIMGYQFYTGC